MPLTTTWVDRVLDIWHDTGFNVYWANEDGEKPCNVGIKLPDQKDVLWFAGQSWEQACWALCVSEFPDPLDQPEAA